MIYILIGFIFLIYYVRKSNTDDLIKKANLNSEQTTLLDTEIINAKTSKIACLLYLIALITLIIIGLIRLTSIEIKFMNYFGTGINHKEIIIPIIWYIAPFVILTIRGIIIEVNVGDYIQKTYNITEEEVDLKEVTNSLKGLLYKKKPLPENTITEEPTPVIETQPKVQEIKNEEPSNVTPVVDNSIVSPVVETPVQNVTPVVEPQPIENVVASQPVEENKQHEDQSNINPFAV